MSTAITIPVLNGDGSAFKLGLNVPASFIDAPAGAIVWSQLTPATGAFKPSNDGRSALYTVAATGSDTVTATATVGSGGLVAPWQPGKLYRLGDQVLDQNGHVQQVTAAKKFIPTVFTPNANKIPQGGDAANDYYNESPVDQFGTVLNTDGGGANGDWPAQALNPLLTGSAPVGYVAAGYSSGRSFAGVDNAPGGIESPNSTGNDSRVQIASYSEQGVGGQKTYFDAAGNLHTGWQVAKGTQDFALSIGQPPAFSTSGGTTLDGDLTWTDEGAAATTSAVSIAITVASGASAPYGYYALLG